MRGYRTLKSQARLGSIGESRDVLASAFLGFSSDRCSRVIFGAGIDRAEQIVRQYLLVRVAYLSFNRAALLAVAREDGLAHSLPLEWRRALVAQGQKVAEIKSALNWQGYVSLLWCHGVITIARGVWHGLRSLCERSQHTPDRYAYFENLSTANVPQPGLGGRSHDILTWYSQWPGRAAGLDSLCHSAAPGGSRHANGLNVRRMQSAVPPPQNLRALARFVGWGVMASVLSALDLARGRWWHAVILSEAAIAAQIRQQPPSALARDYLFHNSGWIYRPLWTYEAERHGARIIFYFYSTNCESLKRPDGYPLQANCWQVVDWPLYLVWDTWQAAFVQRAVGPTANVVITGPIWFSTSPENVPHIPSAAVAVFDVQPYRASRYVILGEPFEYYTPATANSFLVDIQSAIGAVGGALVLKRKRDIGGLLHPRYALLLDRLAASDTFIGLNPNISAVPVIERCEVVVSMPFTSTALLGRHLGKPSIFYDPHGVVQGDDRAAHGIPVITGRAELQRWLSSHLSSAVKQQFLCQER